MHGNMKKFEWKRGYLHGQTGRSTVWADGTQNSGLVNFVPESRLLPKKKRPRRPEPGIKDGFDEWDAKFRPEKQDYLFRRSIATGNFQWNDPKSRAPFTFQTDFLENFGKW